MALESNIKYDNIFNGASKSGRNRLVDYIIDTHEDSVVLCDKKTFTIFAANPSTASLLNIAREDLIGNVFWKFFPIAPSESLLKRIDSLGEGDCIDENISENECVFNVKMTHNDGTLLILMRNLTKHADNIEENNFKMLFENMSSGFLFLRAVTDHTGEIINHQVLDVNSTFEIMFGVDKTDVQGKYITDVLENLDETWMKIFAKSAKTGYSYSGNYSLEKYKKHFEVRTYSPRKGYSAAVFNDIKAEMEIRNDLMVKNEISKAFAIGHNTDLYKIVLDLVLKSTESLYGYIGYLSKKGDIVCFARKDSNMPITIDSHGYERMGIDQEYCTWKSIQSRTQEIGNDFMGHKILLATPVLDEEGKTIGIIGTADSPKGYNTKAKNFIQGLANYISPLMAAEIKERNYKRDLVEAKERAEESEKLKSSFLANISHEIRTPMNGISGFCELLAKSTNLTEKQQKYISIIIKSSRQLLHIVEDIMDMSKLQTQQTKLNVSALHINKIMDEIRTSMLPAAEEKHIQLECFKGLSNDDDHLYGDSYKIRKILESLISNGIKFTNVGSVSFGYRIDNNKIIFTVKDTGIGIRKELHEGIFSSFRQAENVMERKYSGVGIGLSISKGFVDLMDGRIWLESETGVGSTFYVEIKYDPVE